jgi:hypothetical protein
VRHANYQTKPFLILNLSIFVSVFVACSHSAQNSDEVKPESDASTVATELGGDTAAANDDLSSVPVPEPDSLAPPADLEPAPIHHSRRKGRSSVQPTAETEKSASQASVANQDPAVSNPPLSVDGPPEAPPPARAATPGSQASAFAAVPDAAASEKTNEEGASPNPIFPFLITVGLIAVAVIVIRRRGRSRIKG